MKRNVSLSMEMKKNLIVHFERPYKAWALGVPSIGSFLLLKNINFIVSTVLSFDVNLNVIWYSHRKQVNKKDKLNLSPVEIPVTDLKSTVYCFTKNRGYSVRRNNKTV